MPNPLKSYLHSTITTFLSPTKPLTPYETDYEVSDYFDDSTHSISDRIILQRKRLNNSNTNTIPGFSTPIRSRGSPLTEASTIEVGRGDVDEQQFEREKIRQFVDVKTMLKSLRNLERLITDPEVDYDKFKKVYLESSLGLIDSIKENDIVQGLRSQELENKSDLILKIGLIGVQILVVLMDLFKPFLIMFTLWWQQVLSNDVVQKLINTVVELVFVGLSLILDYLKKKQLKAQRKGKTKNRITRYNQR